MHGLRVTWHLFALCQIPSTDSFNTLGRCCVFCKAELQLAHSVGEQTPWLGGVESPRVVDCMPCTPILAPYRANKKVHLFDVCALLRVVNYYGLKCFTPT